MRLLRRLLIGLSLLALLLATTGYLLLRASLPQLEGDLAVAGLTSAVTIERDPLGVATIIANDRNDAAFATGFVHAQERFFQMDLQRRVGAGEVSALFGSAALPLDRGNRVHRFRHRAATLVTQLPAKDRALYQAYTHGVNAGLTALQARPFEYFLLGVKPEPWLVEDTLLTVFSMYFELNDETAERESQLGVLRDLLHPEVYRWLIQAGTDWDAPLRGDVIAAAPMPQSDVLDLREIAGEKFGAATADEQSAAVPGSNNWAVSGARTADGRALLAGDMHLNHAVPNIWLRARVRVGDELDISGVMLSGTPLVIAGSNGDVAWAFTNAYGDWQDLIELDMDPASELRYRTPAGWREFSETVETIVVKDGETEQLVVRETIWGPVVDDDHLGRPRALRWLPHLPRAMNAGIADFETARNVVEALDAANRTGAPPQNFVAADSSGSIGWTVMGQIPRRSGFDSATPASWSDGAGWQGWIAPADYPRIIDPAEGQVWTANARTVDGDWLAMLGQGNHPVGARPRQIRDGLRSRDSMTIDDMLEIQLDDRALFLESWQRLLLDLLTPEALAANPARGELRDLVEQWGGRATVDSAGYRLVRAFRLNTLRAAVDPLLVEVREQLPDFALTRHSQLERPVWQLITEQPPHLLNPNYSGWNEFLLSVVDTTINYYDVFDGTLADRTWGERNTVKIVHPLTRGVPQLSRWLNMPAQQLPGDANMPRVQGPAFGASQRMAVSPGKEEQGYFHMPGGQSGHPLSPFYGSGHADWTEGAPSSFLPGEARHRLVLHPPEL